VLVAAAEVDEHALGCFGSCVSYVSAGGADLGLEHGEEEGGVFEGGAAAGALDVLFF